MRDSVILVTDGASRGNPGASAIAFSIRDASGGALVEDAATIGVATNNEAEYRALIAGLEKAAEHTRGRVEHYTDSEVLAGHMNGTMRVTAEHLKPLHAKATELKGAFEAVRHHVVRRSEPWIARADELANEALDRAARGARR